MDYFEYFKIFDTISMNESYEIWQIGVTLYSQDNYLHLKYKNI